MFFVDETFQLSPTTTRKQAMYIADVFSDKLQMRSKVVAHQQPGAGEMGNAGNG